MFQLRTGNSGFYVNFRFIYNLELGRGMNSHIMTAIATEIKCRWVSASAPPHPIPSLDPKAPPRGSARYYSDVYKANK